MIANKNWAYCHWATKTLKIEKPNIYRRLKILVFQDCFKSEGQRTLLRAIFISACKNVVFSIWVILKKSPKLTVLKY